MKKILLVCFTLLCAVPLFAQKFSQYNTGTLYDSFDNPSQRAFIPDSSKQYAFNFFIPNFNANFFLTGDAQATLKSRAFLGNYSNSALLINQGKYNHFDLNANANAVMFKMFTSLNGDAEFGFSASTRLEGKGIISDESISIFNGPQDFKSLGYTDIFNDKYYYQAYNQLSFSYREKITKQLAFGIKLNALLGIQYERLNVRQSALTFDPLTHTANLILAGVYQSSYIPGRLIGRDALPTFRNPGASISLGTTYRTEDGFILQANIKDLGFIHWSGRSTSYNFYKSSTLHTLTGPAREDSIYNAAYKSIHTGAVLGAFTSAINGRAELSVSKKFWLDDDKMFRYSPTAIASKDLYSPGFTGALVNPVQYKNYVFTLTTTYDDLYLLNVGAQFMIKSSNMEFYFGSDKLTQSAQFFSASGKSLPAINKIGPSTGGDFFLGFSLKLGPVIEHPMNASSIPTGEKGFLGRLYNRLFKTDK